MNRIQQIPAPLPLLRQSLLALAGAPAALLLAAVLWSPCARAAIPAAAIADSRYALGYLVVTHYAGVDPTGQNDSTVGIQRAICDAGVSSSGLTGSNPRRTRKVVLFPPGTYKVNKTLYAYGYYQSGVDPWGGDTAAAWGLQGIVDAAGNRPKIVLANNATGFGSASTPNAILAIRTFNGTGATEHTAPYPAGGTSPLPAHSFALPPNGSDGANYTAEGSNILFNSFVRDLDFDCSGFPGAIGLHFSAAEGSYIANVKVTATGAFAGFLGLPGRSAGAANIEVVGGQYGVYLPSTVPGSGGAGSVIAGARLTGQTVSALRTEDFAPLTLTGFHIEKATCPVVSIYNSFNTASGSLSLLDGDIIVTGTAGSSPVIDNATNAKTLYLRNVFVSGSNNLIKSGAEATVTGTGTWKAIREYSYTSQTTPVGDPPYESGDTSFPTYSMINSGGSVSITRTPQIMTIQSSASSPPADLATRHYWAAGPLARLPAYTGTSGVGEPATLVVPAGSTSAFIQNRIDAAAAGNGRVFLSPDLYELDGPLTLHANTILLGAWQWNTVMQPSATWIANASAGEKPLIVTDNAPNGTTFLGCLEIRLQGGGTNASENFTALHWRAGRNSMVFNLNTHPSGTAPTPSVSVAWLRFSGGGGGRHYFFDAINGPKNPATGGNPLLRVGLFAATTQPVWFYGLGQDHSLVSMSWEATNAANIRIYGFSSEDSDPGLVLNDSSNVALFGLGRNRLNPDSNGQFQVLGASNAILMATLAPQSTNTTGSNFNYLLRQRLTGETTDSGVRWPNHVSLYKLGTLDDAAMAHDNPGGGTVGPFTPQDIGGPAQAGSASLSSGVYTVAGGGADIYGTSDQFHFLHQNWNGDGRVIVRVASIQNTHAWAKAGVMMRESIAADSKNVDLVLTPVKGIQLLHRTPTGGTTVVDALVSDRSAPYWLRLERHADTFTGWQSPDGNVWFLTGATTFAMDPNIRIGLAVTAHDNAQLNTSTFDNVAVSSPPVWTAADIGSVGAVGSTTINYATDTFALNGAGANIYTATDSFHFNHLAWSGDATLVAEVTSVENTSIYAKGGLMIRKSLAANAAHATISVTPGNGVEFLRRVADGNTTVNTKTTGITAPRFLKLVRIGSSFTAYHSPDGGTWTQLGTAETITMGSAVYIGLVSCSIINTTNLCTSTFESVYVK